MALLRYALVFLFVSLSAYERPPTVDEGVWYLVEPYLLPEEHKLKKKLDELFAKYSFRVVDSLDSLKKAGFEITGTPHTQSLYVLRHKSLKGWVIKAYTENNPKPREWTKYQQRCQGAEVMQQTISQHGAEKKFKVPQKYIYPLPSHPPSKAGRRHRDFILIAEDMNILEWRYNHDLWRSTRVTTHFLNLFWTLITESGMADAIVVDNSPFCRDGRVAFLDTEQFHFWPICYDRILNSLSSNMQQHWSLLMKKKGPR